VNDSVALIALFAAAGPATADRQREHATQITHTFVNDSGVAAHGLVIKLSDPAVVVLDESHKAGPFRDHSGNDSKSVRLANPGQPVEAAGTVEVVLRSRREAARISAYWWTDAQGKRVGPKRKL
jgi:hypothetical protein